jgi:hypothetical protein
VVYK